MAWYHNFDEAEKNINCIGPCGKPPDNPSVEHLMKAVVGLQTLTPKSLKGTLQISTRVEMFLLIQMLIIVDYIYPLAPKEQGSFRGFRVSIENVHSSNLLANTGIHRNIPLTPFIHTAYLPFRHFCHFCPSALLIVPLQLDGAYKSPLSNCYVYI
jgi:hypothetical protein